MEKAKFLEAKTQVDIIYACDQIIDCYKRNALDAITLKWYINHVFFYNDSSFTQRFISWVESEKEIAKQKLKEI